MSRRQDTTSPLIEGIRAAFAARDFTMLEPALADDVRWGSCVGRAQVVDYLSRASSLDGAIELADVEALADRLLATLVVGSRDAGDLPPAQRRHVVVLFLRDDRIVELQAVADRDQAIAAAPSPPPSPRPRTLARMSSLAAVLPVRDLGAALGHYERLGFAVSAYRDGGYGYAERDGLQLHFAVVRDLDPATTTSAVYLYVDDADALFAEWRSADVSGQFFAPHDTEYGLREGAHIDRDGNLLRFGSPLAERARRG